MTEAMPFLQKTILLSYDPRPFGTGIFFPTENSLRQRQRELSVCLLGERENHIRNGSFVQVKEYLVNMAKS